MGINPALAVLNLKPGTPSRLTAYFSSGVRLRLNQTKRRPLSNFSKTSVFRRPGRPPARDRAARGLSSISFGWAKREDVGKLVASTTPLRSTTSARSASCADTSAPHPAGKFGIANEGEFDHPPADDRESQKETHARDDQTQPPDFQGLLGNALQTHVPAWPSAGNMPKAPLHFPNGHRAPPIPGEGGVNGAHPSLVRIVHPFGAVREFRTGLFPAGAGNRSRRSPSPAPGPDSPWRGSGVSWIVQMRPLGL